VGQKQGILGKEVFDMIRFVHVKERSEDEPEVSSGKITIC
jgi:hypothetical protein